MSCTTLQRHSFIRVIVPLATVYSLVGSQNSDNNYWNWPAGDVVEYRMSYWFAGYRVWKDNPLVYIYSLDIPSDQQNVLVSVRFGNWRYGEDVTTMYKVITFLKCLPEILIQSVVSNFDEDLQWWCMASWHGIVWTTCIGIHIGRYVEQRIGMYMQDLSFDYLPSDTSVQKYCSWKNSQVPRPLFWNMGNQAPPQLLIGKPLNSCETHHLKMLCIGQ